MSDRKSLPESIQAQNTGLTYDQLETVELYGALMDRASEAGATSIEIWTDENNRVRCEVDFEPIIVTTDSAGAA